MSSLYIPDKVAKFNAYSNGIKLGITGKVDTPEFKSDYQCNAADQYNQNGL